ncbi:MAG: hypothetical protein KDA90_05095 [Planctomycetaceae bacterium]|nr:hypothetical protein [Planctomycetaceae bacterium]
MSTTTYIAAKLLIWLAAMSVPVQGMPVGTCGCTTSRTGCSVGESGEHSCCSSGNSCCGRGEQCTCGADCQCGKQQHQKPIAPAPVEDSQSVEKLLTTTAAAANAVVTISIRHCSAGFPQADYELNAVAALDRCLSLCRLTI